MLALTEGWRRRRELCILGADIRQPNALGVGFFAGFAMAVQWTRHRRGSGMHGVATRFESLVGGVLDRRFWLLWYCGWLAVSVSRRARPGVGGALARFLVRGGLPPWGTGLHPPGFPPPGAGVPRTTPRPHPPPPPWRGGGPPPPGR